MASDLCSLVLLSLLFSLASSELVLEDGYTVTTVVDGHKLKINPHSVISPPGWSDLLVLDSSDCVFYTLSLPLSQESVVKRFSGELGQIGYSDGTLDSALFNKPRSFTVDVKGNVYVADKNNHVIRKITNSGVTTIAGGYSRSIGKEDGPAQNASFSSDFELTFVPQICALLLSDHGHQLIRQINLKAEDCARSSHSALGAASVWVLGLVLSGLLGLVIGIVVRPYIIPHTGRPQPPLFHHDMEALSNQSGERSTDSLLRHQKQSRTPQKDSVPLLDSDDVSGCERKKSQIFAEQLKDLISFDGNQNLLTEDMINHRSDVLSDSHGRIDDMIQANIMGFAGKARETTPEVGTLIGSTGLVWRRQ